VFPVEVSAGAGLRLEDLVLTPTTAVALLVAEARTAACPRCGTPSSRPRNSAGGPGDV
jgi:hypothetical protein